MKKAFCLLLLLLSLFVFVSCDKEKDQNEDKSNEELNINLDISSNDVSSILVGESKKLVVEYNGGKELTWSSSDNNIITVLDGVIVGISEGSVTITVTDGEVTDSKEIACVNNKIDITIIGVNKMNVDQKYQFNYELSKETTEKVIWRSDDENILKIDENGLATALKPGKTKIFAILNDNICEFDVEVIYIMEYLVLFDIFDVVIVAEGEKLNKPADPVREGYVFLGWYLNNELYDFDSPVFSDLDLEAKFEEIKEEKEYTVTFVVEGVKEIQIVKGGEKADKPEDPVKPGYIFIGWYIGNEQYLFNVVKSDIEVEAKFAKIAISGSNVVRVDESIYLKCNVDCIWSSSDEDIAIVLENGEVIGTGEGVAVITATSTEDSNVYAQFEVKVNKKLPLNIAIEGKNKVCIDGSIILNVISYPSGSSTDVVWVSSDENIATISEDGVVFGVSLGNVSITAFSKDKNSIYTTFNIEVIMKAPESIVLSGENEMMQGGHNYIEVTLAGENINREIIWETSDPTIAIVYYGIVLGVNKGKVNIIARSASDNTVYDEIEIEVKQFVSEEPSQEDLNRVNEILSKMTLSQKVGQMFVIGISGTSYSNDIDNVLKEYNFGNVIYMGYNVTSPSTLAMMSNNIQNAMVKYNSVPGFISIDQEGGRVARLTNGGTHFVSNMLMAATNDFNNTYLEGKAMGQELRNYGINVNFAPVLDVNNNPNNPIIGIRSYSDNPLLVSLYGKNMFTGLQESNVMGCSKHFPGHGNTATDTHYGLPTITSTKDELYQTELAPFISSIANGIDAIMTTHIIFSAIDNKYPATLSEKVLTNLLREELGYEGLIITDGMEMDAVAKNFGDYSKTGVLAVKAGVDILTYTSSSNPKKAYNGIMEAFSKGEITEERINESVRRILLKKLKYNILDGYQAENKNITEMLEENNELNLNFARTGLTLLTGEFNGLDKSKSTIIVSPSCNYDLGNISEDSFACYAANYLKQNGFNKVDYYTCGNNISNDDASSLLKQIENYDQVVLAFSNVKTSSYSRTQSFVNNVGKLNKDLLVIALDTPYDLLSYNSNIKNYVCVYGYQKASVIALAEYLNGEFKASGKSPIDEEIFKK